MCDGKTDEIVLSFVIIHILYGTLVILTFRVFFLFPTREMMALWMSIYLH